MTLKELYTEIEGNYDQALSVLRIEKLVDKHIKKLPANPIFAELEEAVAASPDTSLDVHVKEELGDLIFAVANLARHLKADAESALENTTAKFSRRFRHVEAAAKEQGKSLKDMTLDEMDALWEAAKKKEGGAKC